MPVTSQAQAKFMGAVAGGKIHKKGLSKTKAKEFLRGVKVKKLPKRKKKGYDIKKAEKKLGILYH